jgi:hypothetical protein
METVRFRETCLGLDPKLGHALSFPGVDVQWLEWIAFIRKKEKAIPLVSKNNRQYIKLYIFAVFRSIAVYRAMRPARVDFDGVCG